MQTEIEQLREENARLKTQAEEVAALSDFFKTTMLLPLAVTGPDEFRHRISLAMRFHGMNPDTPMGQATIDAFVAMFAPERERLLRMFSGIAKRREPTEGCDCTLCSGITNSRKIRDAERQAREALGATSDEIDAEMVPHDFYGLKDMEDRLTEEDRRKAAEMASRITGILTGMGLLSPEFEKITSLLSILGGHGLSRPGVSFAVYSLGPDGNLRLLGGGETP